MPFASRHGLRIMTLVSQGTHPPRLHDPPLKDERWGLIEWCWAMTPSERPAIKVITDVMMSDPDRHPLSFLLFILKDLKVRQHQKVHPHCTNELVAWCNDRYFFAFLFIFIFIFI
jgi:hypothetical protein